MTDRIAPPWAMGPCIYLLTLMSAATCAEEFSGKSFLTDDQFSTVQTKVTSIVGEYLVEYVGAPRSTEVERRWTVKQWMTRTQYRYEVIEENLSAPKKYIIARKEVVITSGNKTYAFDALAKRLTVRGAEGNWPIFSNPLCYKQHVVSTMLIWDGIRVILPQVAKDDYLDRFGAKIVVTQAENNSFKVAPLKDAPDARYKVIQFDGLDRIMPQTIECYAGQVIDYGVTTERKDKPQRVAVWRLADVGSVTVAGTKLIYPKQIDVMDGSGAVRVQTYRVKSLEVNKPIADDVFEPDYSVADRIVDDTEPSKQ